MPYMHHNTAVRNRNTQIYLVRIRLTAAALGGYEYTGMVKRTEFLQD